MAMTEQMTADEFVAMQASTRGSRAGKRAAAGGLSFEKRLDHTHEYYQRCGFAMIRRLPVPTAPLPKSRLPEGAAVANARILAKRQMADYFGVMHSTPKIGAPQLATGTAISMEAKACARRQASLAVNPPKQRGVKAKSRFGLQYHQLEGLVRWAEFGGVACVVWRNGNDDDPKHQRLVVPIAELRAAFRRAATGGGTTTIKASDCVEYQTRRAEGGFLLEDWLPVAVQASSTGERNEP